MNSAIFVCCLFHLFHNLLRCRIIMIMWCLGVSIFSRRPAFYLAAELASMPQESLITPYLADFLEQMLEVIPVNNMESSLDLSFFLCHNTFMRLHSRLYICKNYKIS